MKGTQIALLAALGVLSAGPTLAQDTAAVQKGKEVYQQWCAICHGRGPGYPGTGALQTKYQGALPAVLDDRNDLTVAGIRAVVRGGISIMPFFRKTEVSDADQDALIAYLRRPRTPSATADHAK